MSPTTIEKDMLIDDIEGSIKWIEGTPTMLEKCPSHQAITNALLTLLKVEKFRLLHPSPEDRIDVLETEVKILKDRPTGISGKAAAVIGTILTSLGGGIGLGIAKAIGIKTGVQQ